MSDVLLIVSVIFLTAHVDHVTWGVSKGRRPGAYIWDQPQPRPPGRWVSTTWLAQHLRTQVQVSSVARPTPAPTAAVTVTKPQAGVSAPTCCHTLCKAWSDFIRVLTLPGCTFVKMAQHLTLGCRTAHRKISRRNNCSATIWFKRPQPSRASFSKLKQTRPQWLKFCPLVVTSCLP